MMKQREKFRLIRMVIREIEREDGVVFPDELYDVCETVGVSSHDSHKIIHKLKIQGDIYQRDGLLYTLDALRHSLQDSRL